MIISSEIMFYILCIHYKQSLEQVNVVFLIDDILLQPNIQHILENKNIFSLYDKDITSNAEDCEQNKKTQT
jgi:hypothetical protein